MNKKKALLTSINSKYIHTNLAIRYIYKYIKKNNPYIDPLIFEFTAKQNIINILENIHKQKPHYLLFSVYIWNTEITLKIVREIKKILPDLVIILGGPEAGYKAVKLLNEYSEIDFIIEGEGEIALSELLNALEFNTGFTDGIHYRKNGTVYSKPAKLIENLDVIPFPYEKEDAENLKNRIIYYESSRGCPYSCSYCMSSIEKTVRFFSVERVYSDIDFFLENKIRLVKFVDRTFNIKKERYRKIWQYIIDNHNGVTVFHFEITAELLDEDDIKMLENIGKGIFQFEIGIQSITKKTLEIVMRNTDTEKQRTMIKKISRNIHLHLDLIAGLPGEGMSEIEKSFNYVMELKPDMIQLGFLKILSGTLMEKTAVQRNFKYLDFPPYEVIKTDTLDFNELKFIREIEKIVDIYYNSHRFNMTLKYLLSQKEPFSFFKELTEYLISQNHLDEDHGIYDFYNYINQYLTKEVSCGKYYDFLKFDFMTHANVKNFPEWFARRYDKEGHERAINRYIKPSSYRDGFINSNYEEFDINPFTGNEEYCKILFIYHNRICTDQILIEAGE